MCNDLSPAALELRTFLGKALPEFHAEWGDDRSFAARRAWQARMNEGRWAAPSWPVEFGGRGLTVTERVECDTELARVGAPIMAGVLGLQNVGPALIMFGTYEQRELLPRILSGDEIWVQGFSEPGAGSDLASLLTRAELDDDVFTINGQKVWTTNGMEATHGFILARTDRDAAKHRGLSVLLVDLQVPGIDRRPLRQITGESEFAEMFFTDVRVPRSALLGGMHDGWRVTMETLGYERTGVINMAARLQREVEKAVAQLEVSDPAIRDQLTRRWMEGKILGLMGARALAGLQQGQPPGAEQSIIKFGWSLAQGKLGETIVDAAGPGALVGNHPATFDFLRSRASTIAAGTTEVLRTMLGERVLGLPRET
ncbi:MAG: hypothetical protein C0482_23680 [Gordonia sp.]|nr:hypothetical protein [Gordonia sp. (in: high G+C Gram-positive bacteria)]